MNDNGTLTAVAYETHLAQADQGNADVRSRHSGEVRDFGMTQKDLGAFGTARRELEQNQAQAVFRATMAQREDAPLRRCDRFCRTEAKDRFRSSCEAFGACQWTLRQSFSWQDP